MDRLENEIINTIRCYGMIPEGSDVAVGFSGGADSLCLLYVLHRLRRLLRINRLLAVHVNHNLRGMEAERDESFSRDFCLEQGIEFKAVSVDVAGLSESSGMSTEEAGRKLRYEALRSSIGSEGIIAVAHHADDSAETILLNLARGTGFRGAAGILPARAGIIRPLIRTSRGDILAYLDRRGLSYVTDSTNLQNDYTRNVIRNSILPLFREHVNSRVSEHLLDFGSYCREADDFFRSEAKAFLEEFSELEGHILRLKKKEMKEKPQIIRRYVIIEAFRRLDIPLKDLTSAHFEAVDGAVFAGRGYHVDLPGGVCVEDTYKETCIFKREG